MRSNYGQLSNDNVIFIAQENTSKLQSCHVFDNFFILIVNKENRIIAQYSTDIQHYNTLAILYLYITSVSVALTGYNSRNKEHGHKK